MSDKIYTELIKISESIGEIKAEVGAHRSEYLEGKQRSRAHGTRVLEELTHKVDKREVTALMKLNWVLSNPKLFVTVLVVASMIGVELKLEVLASLLK